MSSQSARLYMERKGLLPTYRSTGMASLDVRRNVVRNVSTIIHPDAQLVTSSYGSPDMAGISKNWPSQDKSNA